MEAIILAGGLGTRLGELANGFPKPMIEINKRPFLSYLMDSLAKAGVSKIVLAVGYKSEIIIEYFGFSYKSMEIEYSKEEDLLGTGGALKKALNLCSGNQVLALNGDTFNILDFKRMFSLHKKWGGMVTMAVCCMEHFDRFGTVEISDGIVSSFKEKGKVEKGFINRGVYIINRNFLKGVKKDKFSFERDVLEKYKGDIQTYSAKGYFIDIGIPEDYRKACLYLNSEDRDD